MNIIDIIRKRKSCRTFKPVLLDATDKKELENYIIENKKKLPINEILDPIIIEKTYNNKLKLDYGMIQGHNTYLLGTSKATTNSRINYGYLLEKILLKATEIGISSCWIGYFDSSYFNEITVEKGFEIPGIIILGYPKEKQTNLDKFIRFTSNASKRKECTELFFNYNSQLPLNTGVIQEYADSLEMVRLAPSSGNTQPWRIFFDDKAREFHFFKKPINKRYEEKGLHDIDMGIALSHFELTSSFNNLSGTWIKYPKNNVNSIDNLQYIMTWKCK
jgi:nitroreductase